MAPEKLDPKLDGLSPKIYIFGDNKSDPIFEGEWSVDLGVPFCDFTIKTLKGNVAEFRLSRSGTASSFLIENLSNQVTINSVSIGGSPLAPEIQMFPLTKGEKLGLGNGRVIELDGEWFMLDYIKDLNTNGQTYQASFRRISKEEYERINADQLEPRF